MKSILYAGAALMIGASIYGFVDYSQASNKKEFNDMYTVEKEKPAVATLKTDNDQPTKQAIRKEDKTGEKKNVTPVNIKAKKEDKSEKYADEKKKEYKVKKEKRKLSTKLFSRAPLREEMEELPAQKNETKKTERKDQ
ncbi:MAG: hypothetical protein WAR38_06555 [Chitinophagaceae bacterium]